MAVEGNEWLMLLGVFVVIAGVIAYNAMRARASPIQAKPKGADAEPEHEGSVDPILSRFAVHEGDVVGETVAREGGQLILKQAGVFKAVPMAMATLEGDEVQLRGDIDWGEAEAAGTAWLESNRQGHHAEITQELTRSEDVRAPALDAFRSKMGEKLPEQLRGTDSEE